MAGTAAPGMRGSTNRAWMWGSVFVPLPGHPGGCPSLLGRKDGRRPRPPRCPMGPGLAVVSRGDKEPPVSLGVCRDRTKPGPASHRPLAPALSPSSPFVLSFLPRGCECDFPASAQNTRAWTLSRSLCGRIPKPGLDPREVVAVPGTKGVSSWISQPAMELRCYLSQDTRSACDCLNPITVLKIGIRDKYCELQKEPAV